MSDVLTALAALGVVVVVAIVGFVVGLVLGARRTGKQAAAVVGELAGFKRDAQCATLIWEALGEEPARVIQLGYYPIDLLIGHAKQNPDVVIGASEVVYGRAGEGLWTTAPTRFRLKFDEKLAPENFLGAAAEVASGHD